MDPVLLNLAGVSKSYAGNFAIQDIALEIRAGDVHALVGENGAGKSTLVKIISGGIAADSGVVTYRERDYRPRSPFEAQQAGIVAVQQELSLSPYLPVYQNLWLGHESSRGSLFIRMRDLRRRAVDLCSRYGVHANIEAWVSELSLEEQQVVEVLKAVALEPRLIILDEPTSALGSANTRWLLDLVRRLKDQGCAVLFISHRLSEVMEASDEITVLKDGRAVATVRRADVTEADVVRMMVGRDLKDIFPPKLDPGPRQSLPVILEVDRLRTDRVQDVSFTIRRGEVVGLAGLEGQGQHELILALFGLKRIAGGNLTLQGQAIREHSPSASVRRRVGLVPVDRRTEGVILPLSVSENIAHATLGLRSRAGWVDRRREAALVQGFMKDLAIRAPGARSPVGDLSGGNQQKVALGKWLALDPRFLLLDDPTRGVDIETRRDIYHRIRALASQGVGILLNSTDAIELVGICDRVLVMYEGRIVRELSGPEITEGGIVGAAVGVQGGTNGSS
ncbi:MAG TPA: sugar ABC transporter ATP-binding protein [Spirochaetia bacterium]|nr:sugar ABC transporter ATP-binding protein [Spirochaetia bacterium]